jgi:hypothetical protein
MDSGSMTAAVQLARLQESVVALKEQVVSLQEDLHETLQDMERRLSAQERWHARLTGIWIAGSVILGYLFGKG